MTRANVDERSNFNRALAGGFFAGTFCDWLHTSFEARDAIDAYASQADAPLEIDESATAYGSDPFDLGITPSPVDVTVIEYCVMSYDLAASDAERVWNGRSPVEAQRQVDAMRKRWPNATVRLTQHTYYRTLGAGK